MDSDDAITLRLALLVQALVLVASLGACSNSAECFEPSYSKTYLDQSGSIMIEVNSAEIVISNGSPYPIYHEIFPTEFLSRIEWGPCEDLGECSELRIDPGELRRHDLQPLGFDDSRTLRVFWWHLSEPEAGLVFSSYEMESLEVEFPSRVSCK